MTDEFDDLDFDVDQTEKCGVSPRDGHVEPKRAVPVRHSEPDRQAVAGHPAPRSMLEMVHQSIQNPAIDPLKVREMLGVLEQVELRAARQEFEAALFNVTSRIGQVAKQGRIPLKNKDGTTSFVKFGTFNDMDVALRPLLVENSLRASFTASQRQGDGGGGVITARVTHVNGQFAEAEVPLPLDVGPGRNNLQAMGSTLSYGKRYSLAGLLNIVFYDEDDDGNAFSAQMISGDQVAQLRAGLLETGSDEDQFCEAFGLNDGLQGIRATQFQGLMNKVEDKRRRLARAPQRGVAQ